MKPTRRTQPYRANKHRPLGPVLGAMRKGKPAFMANPMDAKRKLQARKNLSRLLSAKRSTVRR